MLLGFYITWYIILFFWSMARSLLHGTSFMTIVVAWPSLLSITISDQAILTRIRRNPGSVIEGNWFKSYEAIPHPIAILLKTELTWVTSRSYSCGTMPYNTTPIPPRREPMGQAQLPCRSYLHPLGTRSNAFKCQELRRLLVSTQISLCARIMPLLLSPSQQ